MTGCALSDVGNHQGGCKIKGSKSMDLDNWMIYGVGMTFFVMSRSDNWKCWNFELRRVRLPTYQGDFSKYGCSLVEKINLNSTCQLFPGFGSHRSWQVELIACLGEYV